MAEPGAPLSLRVTEAQALTPLIRLLTLRADDQRRLPAYSAGAHLRVRVELPGGSGDWRHYSLVDLSGDPAAMQAPRAYRIAVLCEQAGRGGSRFMHRLQPGQAITVQAPKNDFALHAGLPGAVLLAGGIGITPLAGMAAQRSAQGLPVRLHYAGRSRPHMAFVAQLQALLGPALRLHADDEQAAPLDIAALLDSCQPDDRLYVCGPKGLLDAALAASAARGWPPERLRFESFATPVAAPGDQPFEVELARSGLRFTVPADQSLLDCLIAHGCDPMYDCRRGECGVCATPVLAGEIDHRDHVLTPRERDAGNLLQSCISRARGPLLVLDI